jgi:L-malate glycosyltransferase
MVMKIVIIIETLHVGGAETFVVRLANGLAAGHNVTLINLYPNLSKKALMNQVSNQVKLTNLRIPLFRLFSKLDSLLCKMKIDFSFIEHIILLHLKEQILTLKPDVVHSHLFKVDYYVARLKNRLGLKLNHVSTNHGDYLLFDTNDVKPFLNYQKKLRQALASLNVMVTISADQMKWALGKRNEYHYNFAVIEILNGYTLNPEIREKKLEYNLKESDFIYGMVGRGIKEKGWRSLINAFNKLNVVDKKLVLVGTGPELDNLKTIHGRDENIIFVGYSTKPVELINFFDVAVFTSHFASESLPTVVIEYLLCNKPIIATDIGAVKYMLQSPEGKTAGLLIDYKSGKFSERELEEKMFELYHDETLRNELVKLSQQAILKFNMQQCIDSYLRVYGECAI